VKIITGMFSKWILLVYHAICLARLDFSACAYLLSLFSKKNQVICGIFTICHKKILA